MSYTKRSLAFAAMLATTVTAWSQTPAINLTVPGDYTQGSYINGFLFESSQAISVTSLGYFYDPLVGWGSSHPVGLYSVSLSSTVNPYDGNGYWQAVTGSTLLASTTLTTANASSGYYKYGSLASPVTLAANTLYALTGLSYGDPYTVFSVYTVSSPITFEGGAGSGVTTTSTFAPPTTAYTNAANFGSFPYWPSTNILFNAVPEPTPFAAVGLGVLALVRRKRPSKRN